MAQKRYHDYYSRISSRNFNEKWTKVIDPGIYEGFVLYPKEVLSPVTLNASPGKIVTPDGVVIEEAYPVTVTGVSWPDEEDTKQVWSIVCDYRWSEYDPGITSPPEAEYIGLPGSVIPIDQDPDFDGDGAELDPHHVLMGYVVIPWNIVAAFQGIRQEMIYQFGTARMSLGEFTKDFASDDRIFYDGSIGVGSPVPEGRSIYAKNGIDTGEDYYPVAPGDVTTVNYMLNLLPGHRYWGLYPERGEDYEFPPDPTELVYCGSHVGIRVNPEEFDDNYHLDVGGRVRIKGGEGTRLEIESPEDNSPTVLIGRQIGQPSIKSTQRALMIEAADPDPGDVMDPVVSINHMVGGNVILCAGGGKVGINEIDPEDTLHVDGSIRSNSLIVTGPTTLNDLTLTGIIDSASIVVGEFGARAFIGKPDDFSIPVFCHNALSDKSTGYAIAQNPAGRTVINAALYAPEPGDPKDSRIHFRMGNVDFMRVAYDEYKEEFPLQIDTYAYGEKACRWVHRGILQIADVGSISGYTGLISGRGWIGSRGSFACFANNDWKETFWEENGNLQSFHEYAILQGTDGRTFISTRNEHPLHLRAGTGDNALTLQQGETTSDLIVRIGSGSNYGYENVECTIFGNLTVRHIQSSHGIDLTWSSIKIHRGEDTNIEISDNGVITMKRAEIGPISITFNSQIRYDGDDYIVLSDTGVSFKKPVSFESGSSYLFSILNESPTVHDRYGEMVVYKDGSDYNIGVMTPEGLKSVEVS